MNRSDAIFDVTIIGGGINGAGIAADAAGRGLRVLLLEQGDLAGATSSASTKLIHGGLRYLETYEFALVRKALKESQLLVELAPHLVRPITIHIPYLKHLRPWILIRAGLLIYNHLASRPSYPSARGIRLGPDSPLIDSVNRGFSFSDAQVDDARLVIANAIQAGQSGAEVRVRHRCTALNADGDTWRVKVTDLERQETLEFGSRVVVNATGPWVSMLVDSATDLEPRQHVRLVKGSHLVVPRAYPGEQAYLLQNEDGRIVFVIPYQDRFTLIGTTEEEYHGDPAVAAISESETDYLLEVYNSYFKSQLNRQAIVSSWAGIRPLIEDDETSATKVSRDYRLEFENTQLPLLSVYGGKITTYRLLAEQAVDMLAPYVDDLPESGTSRQHLPGGNFESHEQLIKQLASRYAWLETGILSRWVAAYGTRVGTLLGEKTRVEELGIQFGHGLTQVEVDYLVAAEWAHTAQDILWRRTRLGLLFDANQAAELEKYLTTMRAGAHPQAAQAE